MKVALLQCNTITGDIVGNTEKILRSVKNATASGAGLCITPELSLCGLAPQHLLFSPGFVEGCRTALQDMAKKLKGGPAVLVGAPMITAHGKDLTNAAILLHNGTISVVSSKILCPNSTDHGHQYFESGASCGVITLAGWRLGVVLCEDDPQNHAFWKTQHNNAQNPLTELIAGGVDGIVHMACNAYVMHGQEKREHILSHVAARHHIHVFSANTVGGNDTTIYGGQSLAFGPTGTLLARGYAFEEDLVMVDTAVENELSIMACPVAEEECWHALVLGTRDYVQKSGMENVVIGLSGGLDSAMVAAIAVEALGKKHVRGVCMPSPYTSQESLDYAKQLAKNLGIPMDTIAIEPLMQGFEQALTPSLENHKKAENDVTYENIQARIRGTLLMGIANATQSMVLNTGNKSEGAMGYCTLYGDAVGGLSVIGDISKSHLYEVARWYNTTHPQKAIPQGIINRPPTAELRPNQLDSDSLPPYDALDGSMKRILHTDLTTSQESQENPALDQRVFNSITKAEFKRRQCPPALTISTKAFGKSWCIPVVSKVRLPQ